MESFRLERQIPLALIVALITQTLAALFWAGTAVERLARVEENQEQLASIYERVVRLEEKVSRTQSGVERVEANLEKLRSERR